jgi:hypothetical protein
VFGKAGIEKRNVDGMFIALCAKEEILQILFFPTSEKVQAGVDRAARVRLCSLIFERRLSMQTPILQSASCALVAISLVILQLPGCLDKTQAPSGVELATQSLGTSVPDAALQVDGYVSFRDGSHQTEYERYVRAYYDTGGEVPSSADEIDVPDGHYGCSGNNSDWPTGDYHLETDIVYRNGIPYQGSRWVYHVYGTPTRDQDITLVRYWPK